MYVPTYSGYLEVPISGINYKFWYVFIEFKHMIFCITQENTFPAVQARKQAASYFSWIEPKLHAEPRPKKGKVSTRNAPSDKKRWVRSMGRNGPSFRDLLELAPRVVDSFRETRNNKKESANTISDRTLGRMRKPAGILKISLGAAKGQQEQLNIDSTNRRKKGEMRVAKMP